MTRHVSQLLFRHFETDTLNTSLVTALIATTLTSLSVITAFILSKVDYFNVGLTGLPKRDE